VWKLQGVAKSGAEEKKLARVLRDSIWNFFGNKKLFTGHSGDSEQQGSMKRIVAIPRKNGGEKARICEFFRTGALFLSLLAATKRLRKV